MSDLPLVTAPTARTAPAPLLLTAIAGAGLLAAVLVAELTLRERYLLATAAVLVLPVGAALYRRPFAVMSVWLLFAPLLMAVDDGGTRRLYWLVHRALPVAALAATLLAPLLGTAVRRLPRLGLPELLMAGYVVATLVSIALTSSERTADVYLLYDRVVVPIVLYLVIRLHLPDAQAIERWFPVLAALLLSQAAFGIASWVAPDLLPDPWLNRAGSRTTGSLRNPNVYGAVVLFAGVLAFQLGRAADAGWVRRALALPLLVIGCAMAFLTLSRAVWLAAIVVLIGVAIVHPRSLPKVLLVAVPVVMLVTSAGLLGIDQQRLTERLHSDASEESALSRLPVVVASVRMFDAKPLTGWGYNRFDDFDQEFQGAIDGVFVPTKDHASHNLHLTILAEQGLIGFAFYLGPAAILLVRTIRSRRSWLRRDLRTRHLITMLWFLLGAHLIVTTFSNMRVPFGLGIWWICLGLIAALTDPRSKLDEATPPVDQALAVRT